MDDRRILERVDQWITSTKRRTVFYVNSHCLNLASAAPAYKAILNNADLVYADGVGVVWASRFLGGCVLRKATGADWIGHFCDLAESGKWRIYILAGKPGIAMRAREKLVRKFPRLNVVGVCDGFFGEAQQQVLQDIATAAPQILFVGMGTPRQENWIAANRDQISAPICWAVGALFDYVAGAELRVPALMNHIGLEWFWRLLADPRGKWRRYLLGNPMFVSRVVQQKLALQRRA